MPLPPLPFQTYTNNTKNTLKHKNPRHIAKGVRYMGGVWGWGDMGGWVGSPSRTTFSNYTMMQVQVVSEFSPYLGKLSRFRRLGMETPQVQKNPFKKPDPPK